MDGYKTIKNSLDKVKRDAYSQIEESEKPDFKESMSGFWKQSVDSLCFILF